MTNTLKHTIPCLEMTIRAANFKKLQRRAMTLLEMMIVIGLLSLMAGLIAINIGNATIDQRFRNEVSRVVDEIRLAQDLMLVLGTDVHLIFASEGDSVKYWLELETTLPPAWEKEIKRPRRNLKTIRGVFIHDTTEIATAPAPAKGRIDLKFLSNGSVMSNGILRLSTSDQDDPPANALNSYICLPGYPHPIFSSNQKDADPACNLKDDESNDRKLTEDTMARLPEKVKNLEKIAEEQKSEETEQQQQQQQTNTSSSNQGAKKTTQQKSTLPGVRSGQETTTKLPPR